jgi:hypothetical protein
MLNGFSGKCAETYDIDPGCLELFVISGAHDT